MRTTLTTTAVALAPLALNAGPVSAQNDESSGTTGVMTTTPSDGTSDAKGTLGTTTDVGDIGMIGEDHPLYSMRSDQIVGQTLYGSNGEEIGEVERVVTRRGGSSPEAVVSVGGFLGIGDRDVSIPLSQIQMQDDRLTTSTTKESLGAMQPYEESGYQEWDSSRTFGSTDQ
jgi:hypothetical protein